MKKLTAHQVAIIEGFSWYGVVAILSAYLMVSLGVFAPGNILVVFLNVSGSIAGLLDAWKDKNYQPIVINIVWITIAIVALIRAFV